ncbi:Transcription termination factor 2 [Orchesella cincta]|uniref:Transcription termination factor 2 n=1 Tax=Orchesella cincta TaxID=48709 RepID=A0A1D2MS20_ORCCI|nr:Transcription termination factor 2 [Orchesella cincta]
MEANEKNKFLCPEDIVDDAFEHMALNSAKPFSFTKKRDDTASTKKATGHGYFDEETEERDDSYPNSVKLDPALKSQLGDMDSGLQAVQETPLAPSKGFSMSQKLQLRENLQKMAKSGKWSADPRVSKDDLNNTPIPLGMQKSKQSPKIVLLEKAPPIEHPMVYGFDDSNNDEEYYGSVKMTVFMLTESLGTMPIPSENPENDDLPKGLVPLYDHQRNGLKWLSWREGVYPGGGILADEMGLGKTIMMIALIMKSKAEGPPEVDENWVDKKETIGLHPSDATLVVCPVGCVLQWQDEIESKGKGLRVQIFHGTHRTGSVTMLANNDVVLTTYNTVSTAVAKRKNAESQLESPLLRIYWRRIILDEVHNISNPKTQRAVSICRLSARHRWAVTGTPVYNTPADFFSIVKFLRIAPLDEPKVWDYCIGLKAFKTAKEAQDRLDAIRKALILRRTKTEVEAMGGNVRAIPPKTVETIELDLNEAETRVYDHLMKVSQAVFKNFMNKKDQRERETQGASMTYTSALHKTLGSDVSDDIKVTHLLARICRLRQCAVLPHLIETMLEEEQVDDDDSFDELKDEHLVSKRNPIFARDYESSKLKKILDDLEEIRDRAEAENKPMDKVVIVSSWTSLLNIISEHLRTRGFSFEFITGNEKMEERMSAVKRFNKYPDRPQIVLLSLATGVVGVNLTGGNYVFFVEPHWNPQMELQAQDCCHRFGQTKEVFIRRYVSKKTIEARVMELQAMKVDLADGVSKNANQSSNGISINQMALLFNSGVVN